jgi:type II secretory pathway predicted ATPase ExeA
MSEEKDWSKVEPLERCRLVESIFIEHERFKRLLELIRHCHEYSKISAEPECMFIGGWAGTGKTTLQKFFAQRHPCVELEERTLVPVLRARVPQRASDKTLVTTLLRNIGDPAAEKGTSFNQTTRLRLMMRECGTEILFLDEFQHFIDKDSEKVLKNISDWLKNLIDETRTPIVMCGMPYADEILDAPGNEQLKRRFSVRARLEPFFWSTKEEQGEFRGFLKSVDVKLPFPKRSQLAGFNMAYRFFCATNGRVGKVMKIVRRAAELAIYGSLECLDLGVLARAYEDRMREDYPDRMNPFATEEKGLKEVPFEEYVPNIGANNRGRSGNGNGGHSASSILRK